MGDAEAEQWFEVITRQINNTTRTIAHSLALFIDLTYREKDYLGVNNKMNEIDCVTKGL